MTAGSKHVVIRLHDRQHPDPLLLRGQPDGHPLAGALASARSLAVVFSRVAELFDISADETWRVPIGLSSHKIGGAFSPDEEFLVFVADNAVFVRKTSTGVCRLVDVAPKGAEIPEVCFSANGEFLVVSWGRTVVYDWRLIQARWHWFPAATFDL